MRVIIHRMVNRCGFQAVVLLSAIIGGCATGTEDSNDSTPIGGADSSDNKRFQVPYQSVAALKVTAKPRRISYGDAEQNFLLYFEASGKPKGTLIFVHGGCWSNQFDLNHANSFAQKTAEAGYDVWSAEYRRTGDPGGGWPGSLIDVVEALDHVHSDRPAQPVVLAGHSAGGHLALLAGAETPQSVEAVIGLAAIARLTLYGDGSSSCQEMVPRFMSGTPAERPLDYRSANPAAITLHPNTVLLQGTADNIVPVEQTRISGASVTLVEGAGHFDWLHYESEAYRQFHRTLGEIASQRNQ